VKTALKSVDFDEVTDKNNLALFMAHGVDAVWDLDLGGPKEACIKWACTLAQRGEYH